MNTAENIVIIFHGHKGQQQAGRMAEAESIYIEKCSVAHSTEYGFADGSACIFTSGACRVLTAKDRSIDQARLAGFTVHAPTDGCDGWAYCIDDYYSKEYATEAEAWSGAIAVMPTTPDVTA